MRPNPRSLKNDATFDWKKLHTYRMPGGPDEVVEQEPEEDEWDCRAANSSGPGGPTGPLGPSSDRESAIGKAPALVPGPLARL
jgi:hypothetical protein